MMRNLYTHTFNKSTSTFSGTGNRNSSVLVVPAVTFRPSLKEPLPTQLPGLASKVSTPLHMSLKALCPMTVLASFDYLSTSSQHLSFTLNHPLQLHFGFRALRMEGKLRLDPTERELSAGLRAKNV